MADTDVMSEAQAAASLRVHAKTLARWRKAGLIAFDRTPGGRIRYQWGDLIEFRRSMHVAANAPVCANLSGDIGAPAP